MSYHIKGHNYKLRTKKDYIDWIIKSNAWATTKTKLNAMDINSLKDIKSIIEIKLMTKVMQKPIPQTHTQTNEVQNE